MVLIIEERNKLIHDLRSLEMHLNRLFDKIEKGDAVENKRVELIKEKFDVFSAVIKILDESSS
jgi:hypothetical protein